MRPQIFLRFIWEGTLVDCLRPGVRRQRVLERRSLHMAHRVQDQCIARCPVHFPRLIKPLIRQTPPFPPPDRGRAASHGGPTSEPTTTHVQTLACEHMRKEARLGECAQEVNFKWARNPPIRMMSSIPKIPEFVSKIASKSPGWRREAHDSKGKTADENDLPCPSCPASGSTPCLQSSSTS